ncbi:MAG: bifunctional hydroxymethylpyrimidine kinase/phosphomethylpyrimidine kinase [Myxococcota bacterium]
MTSIALTIAGSDPSGGAGLQADLKTFHQHGVYGAAAVSLITVQNTRSVSKVVPLEPELLRSQIRAVIEDLDVGAVKTGALGSEANIEVVSEEFRDRRVPLVVDPVMVSTHGALLLDKSGQRRVRALLPSTFLVTPNAPEAALLTGRSVASVADAEDAARALVQCGVESVLVKGGHLTHDEQACDVLLTQGVIHRFPAKRIPSRHTHGTGCSLSAAITAWLAHGESLPTAVWRSKRWISSAIESAKPIGTGIGPINHAEPVVP